MWSLFKRALTPRNLRQPVVRLEIPEAWLANASDGPTHTQFYGSLLSALAESNVLIEPVWLPRGADRAPRPTSDMPMISFHSFGNAPSGRLIRFKESYVSPYYSADKMGYSLYSELSIYPERFIDSIEKTKENRAMIFVSNLSSSIIAENKSKYRQPSLGLESAKGFIFLPLQMPMDRVSAGSNISISDAVECCIEAARRLNCELVIKRHPRCTDRRIDRLLVKSIRHNHVRVSTASINELIVSSSMVVGCNSGVLFEALIHGKKVVSFGRSDFQTATLTACSVPELYKHITETEAPCDSYRVKFLHWYLNSYCVKADDVRGIRNVLSNIISESSEGPCKKGVFFYPYSLYFFSIFDRLKRRIFA